MIAKISTYNLEVIMHNVYHYTILFINHKPLQMEKDDTWTPFNCIQMNEAMELHD